MTAPILLLTLLALTAPADRELLELPGGTDAAAWYTAESEVAADTAHARVDGTPVIHWHVPVDHTAGEPNYPVGWPRTGIAPGEHWDWSGYDELRFWLYTATSRDALPASAMGMVISMPDRSSQTNIDLPAVKDEWVEVVVPMADLANPADVARVQWFIAESNYQHGDTLDVYISEPHLVRYTQPRVLRFSPVESLVPTRGGQLPVDIHVIGVDAGETAPAALIIRRGDTELGRVDATFTRGARRVVLPLPADLTPGPAQIAVRFADADTDAAVAPLSIVRGPFAED